MILHLSSWPSFVIYPYDLKPYTASICYLTSSYFSFSSPHPLLRTSPLHVMPVEYWCAAPRQTLTPARKNNLLQHEVKCALFGRRKYCLLYIRDVLDLIWLIFLISSGRLLSLLDFLIFCWSSLKFKREFMRIIKWLATGFEKKSWGRYWFNFLPLFHRSNSSPIV